MSVRPIGQFIFDDYEDRIEVKLENRGTGPMVLEEFAVMRGSEVVGRDSLVNAKELPFHDTHVANFVAELAGRVLRPGQELLLLQAKGIPTDEAFANYRKSLREYLSKLTFQVTYKDIYGSRQEPTVRAAEKWYGRHSE
jgi:hypothetical protein